MKLVMRVFITIDVFAGLHERTNKAGFTFFFFLKNFVSSFAQVEPHVLETFTIAQTAMYLEDFSKPSGFAVV